MKMYHNRKTIEEIAEGIPSKRIDMLANSNNKRQNTN